MVGQLSVEVWEGGDGWVEEVVLRGDDEIDGSVEEFWRRENEASSARSERVSSRSRRRGEGDETDLVVLECRP